MGDAAAGAREEVDLRACCCCWSWAGVGVVGLVAPGWGSCGSAGVKEVELGRERVEDCRESAAEVRREATGEGGAGREEVRELREDLRPSRDGGLAESVGMVQKE
jgi:hypothetical protein